MLGQRRVMPAHLTTPWLALACCCCLVTRAQAVKVFDTCREDHSAIHRTDGPDHFTLSKMFFTYTGLDPSVTKTTLKMCSAAELSSSSGNTMVTVVFGTPGTQERSVEGALVDSDFCAEFVMEYLVPGTTDPTTYTFVVDDGTLKTSTVAFAMTVDVTVLSCSPRSLSRISWTEAANTIQEECLPYDDTSAMVCYRDADLTDQDVCFQTGGNDNIIVCRQGGVVVASEPSQISVNYLAYDPESPDLARLSLLFNDDAEKSLEVTLWEGSNSPPSVLWCEGTCAMPSFVISNSVYEVCAFSKKGPLRGPLSGFASIQDVNLVAYNIGEDTLFIEFGFINSNVESRLYIASLFAVPPSPDPPVATVTQDCVGVEVDHTCLGFIASTSLTSEENMYVSIQYTDAVFENPTNRIAAKIQPYQNREGISLDSESLYTQSRGANITITLPLDHPGPVKRGKEPL